MVVLISYFCQRALNVQFPCGESLVAAKAVNFNNVLWNGWWTFLLIKSASEGITILHIKNFYMNISPRVAKRWDHGNTAAIVYPPHLSPTPTQSKKYIFFNKTRCINNVAIHIVAGKILNFLVFILGDILNYGCEIMIFTFDIMKRRFIILILIMLLAKC